MNKKSLNKIQMITWELYAYTIMCVTLIWCHVLKLIHWHCFNVLVSLKYAHMNAFTISVIHKVVTFPCFSCSFIIFSWIFLKSVIYHFGCWNVVEIIKCSIHSALWFYVIFSILPIFVELTKYNALETLLFFFYLFCFYWNIH